MSNGRSTLDARVGAGPCQKLRWRATPRFRRVIIAFALLWIATVYGSGFLRIAQEKHRVDELSANLQAAKERIAELKTEIEVRQSDAYVERVAREELGLVKPGEIRYEFVLPPDPTDQYFVPEREGDPPDPNGGY